MSEPGADWDLLDSGHGILPGGGHAYGLPCTCMWGIIEEMPDVSYRSLAGSAPPGAGSMWRSPGFPRTSCSTSINTAAEVRADMRVLWADTAGRAPSSLEPVAVPRAARRPVREVNAPGGAFLMADSGWRGGACRP